MNGKDSETTIEVTNGSISIEYGDNAKISTGSNPAGTLIASKTFTVNGIITGSSNLNYEVDLKVDKNTYEDNQLVYTISSNNDANNGTVIPNNEDRVTLPSGSNTIIVGKGLFAGPITNGAIHTYTINVYVADGVNAPADAAFDASISVYQALK